MSIVYFDTETNPTDHAVVIPPLACITFAEDEGDIQLVESTDPEGIRDCRRFLMRAKTLVGHNTPFDLATAELERTSYRDTFIRAVLLGAAAGEPDVAGHSLETLAKPLGIELHGKQKRHASSVNKGTKAATVPLQLSFRAGVPLTPEQKVYAKGDVVATRAVFQDQGGDVDVSPDEQRQNAYALALFRMARRGLPLDPDYFRQLEQDTNTVYIDMARSLRAQGIIAARGPKLNPWRDVAVSQTEVQRRLRLTAKVDPADFIERAAYARQIHQPNHTVAKKLLPADDAALRASKDPGLMMLADYKRVEKKLGLVRAYCVGPVARSRYKSMVATGRISASDPNITQIPRRGGLREGILAAPGHVLVVADFASLEFKGWGDVCHRLGLGDEVVDAYRAGRDPHYVVVANKYGKRYEQLDFQDPDVKTWRQRAKAVNYGAIGGMGPKRLKEQLEEYTGREHTLAEAREILEMWRDTYACAGRYFTWLEHQQCGYKTFVKDGVEKTAPVYLVTLPWSGRKRKAFYSEAANTMIQGTGADVVKQSMLRIDESHLPYVGLIHDENMMHCLQSEAEYVGAELARCMEEGGKTVCPSVPWDDVEVNVMTRWKSKKA